ncbi:MAG: hypothetical protein CBC09_07535 [Cellvibrionales bacterium TMED49]|nr:hypothetical protein [Porticoccaceae bacterium]OUU37092.1 MAG: hypothetical protein CBC09_07535 [Cellvibrionales bacterium TMED49]
MFEEILIFSTLGILAGLLAGMFGIGGGLIIVPVLIGTFVNLGFNSEIIIHLATGSSISCIIFTSLSSSNAHKKKESIDFSQLKVISMGIVFGSFFGAIFAGQITGITLKITIATFLALVGFQTLFDIRFTKTDINSSRPKSVFAGTSIGFLSSILGIGGGTFSVPYFRAIGLNLKTAIGTSAACGIPIAIFGTLGYIIAGMNIKVLPNLSLGYVYLPALIGISATSIFTAKYGAEIAHHLSQGVLRKLLAMWFIGISMYMFFL